MTGLAAEGGALPTGLAAEGGPSSGAALHGRARRPGRGGTLRREGLHGNRARCGEGGHYGGRCREGAQFRGCSAVMGGWAPNHDVAGMGRAMGRGWRWGE